MMVYGLVMVWWGAMDVGIYRMVMINGAFWRGRCGLIHGVGEFDECWWIYGEFLFYYNKWSGAGTVWVGGVSISAAVVSGDGVCGDGDGEKAAVSSFY